MTKDPYIFPIEIFTKEDAEAFTTLFSEPMNVKILGEDQVELIRGNLYYDVSDEFKPFTLEVKIRSMEDARALYSILNHSDNIKYISSNVTSGINCQEERTKIGKHFGISRYSIGQSGDIARGVTGFIFYKDNKLKRKL